MQLSVNGVVREVPEGITLSELMDTIGVHRDGVAVAVNRTVVPRQAHESQPLRTDDQVEIIQAVGGG